MLKQYFFPLTLVVIGMFAISCGQKDILTPDEKEWLLTQPTFKVSVFDNYPPYQFVNEQGKAEGIFVDYLSLIENKLDYKFDRVLYTSWAQVITDAKNKKVDLILEIQETENRSEYLDFYASLFESNQVIVTRKQQQKTLRLKDLHGKEVIVPEDFAVFEILKTNHPEIILKTSPTDLTSLNLLNSGKFDAYVGPKAVANYWIKTKELNALKINAGIRYDYRPGISVLKHDKRLNEIIAKVTATITEQDRQEIMDNWLYNAVRPFYKKSIFWMSLLLGTLTLLLIISGLSTYLKFKINQRTEELRMAKDLAEQNNQLKINFIRNVSHEIRTPMNAILGFSELLQASDLNATDKQIYTNTVIESGRQLVRIIDDILEVSILESKQMQVHPEETQLDTLFQTLVTIFKKDAENKDLSLTLERENSVDADRIIIDKSKLISILNGLIDNAIKFTKKGQVTVRYRLTKGKLVVEIQDTGIGIKEDDQEIILHSFAQLEKEIAKKYSGLGLGLTLAKKNTNLLDGTLSFESILDRGSIFTLEVPYTLPSKAPSTAVDAKEIVGANHPIKATILIAEDGELNFLLLKTILTKMSGYDFQLERAHNGKEAVTFCLENERVDIVLMDIRMPEMDGYDATRYIKRLRPQLPVIAQTAYSTDDDIQRALTAGCNTFLSKPIDTSKLKKVIEEYILINK